MPSGSFIQAEVKCPFYFTDSNKPSVIRCEGISEDTKLILNFRLKEDKIKYMQKFCSDGYRNCYLYKLAYLKYD